MHVQTYVGPVYKQCMVTHFSCHGADALLGPAPSPVPGCPSFFSGGSVPPPCPGGDLWVCREGDGLSCTHIRTYARTVCSQTFTIEANITVHIVTADR